MNKERWICLAFIVGALFAGIFVGFNDGWQASTADYNTRILAVLEKSGVDTYSFDERYKNRMVIEIPCSCGNVLRLANSFTEDYWPYKFVCADCGMEYVMTRKAKNDNRPK